MQAAQGNAGDAGMGAPQKDAKARGWQHALVLSQDGGRVRGEQIDRAVWFGKIQRDVITRGIFTSVGDLAHKLRKYIRAYGKSTKPFRWIYTDPTRRIQTIVTK
jgi:hypothetical protein